MPTQNTNSLLQSADTDLLEAAEVVGKIYDGSEYINVDNERDRISLKPKALTKVVGSDTIDVDENINAQGNTEYTIHAKKLLQGSRYIEVDNDNDTISLKPEGISKVENSDTTYVTTRTDENGNIAYKVNVNDDIVAPTYTGENPVVVNNTTKKISVNKLPLILNSPLTATVTPTDVTIGCNTPTYTYSHYYDGEIATISITTGDSDKNVELWNYSDLSAGEMIAGTLFVEGFMYARQGHQVSDDELLVRLYFEDDGDVQYDIYKEKKKVDATDIDAGSIIIPFTLFYSDTLATNHTTINLEIESSSNVFLSTTAKVYFDGYRKQAIV